MSLQTHVTSLIRKCARQARHSPLGTWALGRQETWIDISEPRTRWITYVNAGMLHPGSLYLIHYALSHLPSAAPILEIGCFCGLSLNLIDHYRRKLGCSNRLLGCDSWQFAGNQEGLEFERSGLDFARYRALAMDSFVRNVSTFSGSPLPEVAERTSNQFFEEWAAKQTITDVFGREMQLGGPLSFCHIDGDHSYQQASRDFQGCDRFLEVGGFLLLDDSADTSEFEGVRRLVAQILRDSRYEFVARNPHYLFRKRCL